MREIKFRAFDTKKKRFIYTSLHPTHIAWASPKYAEHSLLIDGKNLEGIRFLNIEGWQQSTGLTDKNGVEIFEGDVLKIRNSIGKVLWEEIKFSYDIQFTDRNYELPLRSEIMGANGQCEVIGNIYTTPGLLEAKP